MKRINSILPMAIIVFVACGDEGPTTVREEPAALVGAKADSVDYDNWTYFIVTQQDARKCVSPVCGGVYVKRLNQSDVKCADGKWAKECYVGGLDFAALGLSDDEAATASARFSSKQAVVRGAFELGHWSSYPDVAALAVTEVWVAATDKKPANTWFRAHDRGISCFAAPCPTLEAVKLDKNASPLGDYTGLDLSALTLTDEQAQAAFDALKHDALVVAGKIVSVSYPHGTGKQIKASQIYLPMRAEKAAAQICGTRGAGPCPDGEYCQFPDDMCGKADGPGVCTPMPVDCTPSDEPVCGCEGTTFANDCERQRAGVGYGTPGECRTDARCQIGGCSGELCLPAGSDAGMSICLWKPEYACYQQLGVCETQADGACAWTLSEELAGCLRDAE